MSQGGLLFVGHQAGQTDPVNSKVIGIFHLCLWYNLWPAFRSKLTWPGRLQALVAGGMDRMWR